MNPRAVKTNSSITAETNLGGPYETRKWPYLVALPVMWILTVWVMGKKALWKALGRELSINTMWVDGLNETCRYIKEGAATWRALNLIYNHTFGKDGLVADFWLGMRNAQGVRNRKRLVVTLLVQHLRDLAEDGHVRLLSLASGSAQSVIEALLVLKEEGIWVETVLVDVDPGALEHSRELAQLHGLGDQITILEQDLRDLLRLTRALENHPPFHVIEMVGLLEYVKDKTVVSLVRSARSVLSPEGVFLTASITNNPERWFLHWVINWEMTYRSKGALGQLLLEAGFKDEHCEIISEPQEIFHLATCRNELRCR